ncbi:MAG: 2OG-Fe(II) oxygenase [Deltaproteobacteria bacterium]|nr:2OG-Fe(II) oxygenase [Deltaproteobacteria bacterium]
MAQRDSPQSRDPGAFTLLRVEAADLAEHSGALRQMVEREGLDGLIVRGVITPDEAATLDAAIEAGDPAFPRFEKAGDSGPLGPAWAAGPLIHNVEAGVQRYLSLTAVYRMMLQYLFAKHVGEGLESRIARALTLLGGGRPASIPSAEEGTYMPANLRTLTPETALSVHCGNMFAADPSYQHLNGIVNTIDQWSWYFQIAVPEAGGELRIYEGDWTERDDFIPRLHVEPDEDVMAGRRWMTVDMQPGDLLLFAGGRIYHRVTRVEGGRIRRTLGGFGTFSNDDTRIHFWG